VSAQEKSREGEEAKRVEREERRKRPEVRIDRNLCSGRVLEIMMVVRLERPHPPYRLRRGVGGARERKNAAGATPFAPFVA
jgi:hypothetical protein